MESEEEILVHPKNTWKRSTIRRDIQVSYIYVYMYNNARQKYVRPITTKVHLGYFFISFKGGALDDTRCVHNQLPSVFSCHMGSSTCFISFCTQLTIFFILIFEACYITKQ